MIYVSSLCFSEDVELLFPFFLFFMAFLSLYLSAMKIGGVLCALMSVNVCV